MGSLMEARRRILLSSPHKETIQNADIASFSTDMRSPLRALTLSIDPVQDLHGYDAPWPGGGGKNLYDLSRPSPFNANVTVTRTEDSITVINGNGYQVNVFADGNRGTPVAVTDGRYTISIGEAISSVISVYGSTDGESYSWLANGITAGNTSATFTVSGQIYVEIRCLCPANSTITIKKFQLESGSTATAFAPYSNECPISGWSAANLWRTGKNMLDIDRTLGAPVPTDISNTTSPRVFDVTKYYKGARSDNYYYANYVDVSIASNTVTVTVLGGNTAYGAGFPVSVNGGRSYAFRANSENGIVSFGFYDAWWHWLSGTDPVVLANSGGTATVVAPENAAYMLIVLRSTTLNLATTFTDIQLELSSTPTPYTPYTGTTYPITIPALGKNLLDPSEMTTYSSGNGRRWYYDDGYTLKANQAYTMSVSGTSQLITLYFVEKSTGTALASGSAGGKITYTPETDTVVYFQAYRGEVIQDANNFQLELGSTATEYEPYTNTVYGGYIQVAEDGSAELVVDKGIANLSDINWIADPNRVGVWYGNVSGRLYLSGIIACSCYKADNISVNTTKDMYISGANSYGGGVVFIRDTRTVGMTRAEVQALQTGEKAVYELATPITIPLSDITISTLKGHNVVWGDSGKIELLKYWTH